MYNNNITLNEIEDLRLKMIALADKKGFTHEETVIASQTLDSMMNEYCVERKMEGLI